MQTKIIEENIPIELSLIEDGENKLTSNEKWYTILLQVLFPFFIAGFGMVAAGVVLDKVQVINSKIFQTKFD